MVFDKKDLEVKIIQQIILNLYLIKNVFQILLTHTLSQKHELQFKHIVDDLKIDLNTPQECLENLSIFEKVLSTPKSSNFIELCISSGSSFFKVRKVIIVWKHLFKLGLL